MKSYLASLLNNTDNCLNYTPHLRKLFSTAAIFNTIFVVLHIRHAPLKLVGLLLLPYEVRLLKIDKRTATGQATFPAGKSNEAKNGSDDTRDQ